MARELLAAQGLVLKPSFVDRALENVAQGMSLDARAQHVLAVALNQDLRAIGSGSLPDGIEVRRRIHHVLCNLYSCQHVARLHGILLEVVRYLCLKFTNVASP